MTMRFSNQLYSSLNLHQIVRVNLLTWCIFDVNGELLKCELAEMMQRTNCPYSGHCLSHTNIIWYGIAFLYEHNYHIFTYERG